VGYLNSVFGLEVGYAKGLVGAIKEHKLIGALLQYNTF
jgi:hypothetical protein